MDNLLAQKAIAAAMASRWEEAEVANIEILKQDPKNVAALNRLGRAYLEQGKKNKAKNAFLKVLKIDKYNQIALKNLQLLKSSTGNKKGKVLFSPDLFIEEPGKTKTVTLAKTADKKSLSSLSVGEEVKLKVRKRTIACYSQKNNYIGRLPDDLSLRLAKLINGGNKYQTFIKALNFPEIKVFIKEVKKAKRLAHIPSFPTKGEPYLAYMPPNLVHEEQPEIENSEGEES